MRQRSQFSPRSVSRKPGAVHSEYAANGHVSHLLLDESTDGVKGNFKPYASYVDFNANGKPGRVFHANGVRTHYTFYPLNGLLETVATFGPSSTKLQDFHYYWTNLYNIDTIVDNNVQANSPLATQYFGYDDVGRLTAGTGAYGLQDVSLRQ